MEISNNFVPSIIEKIKQVKMKPTFIFDEVVEFCKMGVHANKKIFRTAWKIDSIIPIDKTSLFFNSEKASLKDLIIPFLMFSSGLFSAQNKCIITIPRTENEIDNQRGANRPHIL